MDQKKPGVHEKFGNNKMPLFIMPVIIGTVPDQTGKPQPGFCVGDLKKIEKNAVLAGSVFGMIKRSIQDGHRSIPRLNTPVLVLKVIPPDKHLLFRTPHGFNQFTAYQQSVKGYGMVH